MKRVELDSGKNKLDLQSRAKWKRKRSDAKGVGGSKEEVEGG